MLRNTVDTLLKRFPSIPTLMLSLLNMFDICVNDASKNIHHQAYYVERMELYSTKCEEPEDCLNNRLGHANHAGGESGAHRGAEKLGVGEDAAGEDEETEDNGEAGVEAADGVSDLGGFTEDHGHGDEDREGVVTIDIEHFNNAFVIQLRTLLDQG